MRFIRVFSLLYMIGSWGLWWAAPEHFNIWLVMLSFGLGLIGMEFATIFVKAMLPDLGPRAALGRISGSAWGFGYAGGVVSLILILASFAEQPSGKTLIGIAPLFGLDPALREGTRAVGPFVAIWFLLFALPFFAWMHEPRDPAAPRIRAAAATAWPDLR